MFILSHTFFWPLGTLPILISSAFKIFRRHICLLPIWRCLNSSVTYGLAA